MSFTSDLSELITRPTAAVRLRAEAEHACREDSRLLIVDPRDVLALCDALDVAQGWINDEIAQEILGEEDVKHFRVMAMYAMQNEFPAPVSGNDVHRLCKTIEVLAARLRRK